MSVRFPTPPTPPRSGIELSTDFSDTRGDPVATALKVVAWMGMVGILCLVAYIVYWAASTPGPNGKPLATTPIDHVNLVRPPDEYGVACYAWNHNTNSLDCVKVQ